MIELTIKEVEDASRKSKYSALDAAEAQIDAMSRDETTTLDDMVEAVRAMKKRYEETTP